VGVPAAGGFGCRTQSDSDPGSDVSPACPSSTGGMRSGKYPNATPAQLAQEHCSPRLVTALLRRLDLGPWARKCWSMVVFQLVLREVRICREDTQFLGLIGYCRLFSGPVTRFHLAVGNHAGVVLQMHVDVSGTPPGGCPAGRRGRRC